MVKNKLNGVKNIIEWQFFKLSQVPIGILLHGNVKKINGNR